MISYADLERVYRLERDSPSLQAIPQNIYSDSLALAEAQELREHKDKIIGLAGEIYERRLRKIVLHAIRSSKEKPPENVTGQEGALYGRLAVLLAADRADVFLQPKAEQRKTIDVSKIKVRILRPMPSIMASDLKEYGPFNGSEVVEMPEENARILITQGIAEEVKPSS